MRIIFLLLCILFTSSIKAQLSGTYTINSNKSAGSTNYTSITAAIGDLVNGIRSDSAIANGPGVSDTVMFLIADGIYKEQLQLGYISGASDTSRVFFKSASEDKSKVVLTWPSDTLSYNNYIIRLINANYCTFSNLTFQRTGSYDYATHVLMEYSDHNAFRNCSFIGGKSMHGQFDASAIYANGDVHYNTYENLFIDSVGCGFFLSGWSVKNRIEGCILNNIEYMAISLLYHDSTIIRNNKINYVKDANAYGIYSYMCNNIQLLGNQINLKNGGSGIYDYESAKKSTAHNLISNNMVSVTGGQLAYGIFLQGTQYVDIINNSVYIGDNTGNTRLPLYFLDGSSASRHQRIFNNNLANYSGGYVIQVSEQSHNNFDSLGCNNYYSTGPYFALWEDTYFSYESAPPISSSSWSTFVTDRQSITVLPKFYSFTDLHSDAIAFNGKAKAWPTVKTDFDGELRDTLKPDIGADEFKIFNYDIKVLDVQKPVPGKCKDTTDLVITIGNNGTSAINNVNLIWKQNATIQDTFTTTVSLASGKDTALLIGKIAWASVSFDNVTIISSDTTDKNPRNDTLTVKYRNGIGGNYTLGTDTSDYPDFASALKDLYKWGVCGDAIFEIADGKYEKAIEILPIPGAGKNSRVIFKSASGDSTKVLLTTSNAYMGSGYVIDFQGADYITFEDVTIQESEEYFYGQTVLLQKQATHNTIKNCLIIGDRSSYNNSTWVISDKGFGNDSNLIENNIIRFGVGSIQLGNNPIQSKSISYGNIIKGNIFDSSYASGSEFHYQEGIQLISNTYVPTISAFDTAFYLDHCNYRVNISGNYINLKYGGSPIFLNVCEAGFQTAGKISNNMIIVGGNTGKNCTGILLSYTKFFDLLHNSIRIEKGNGNSSADIFFNVGIGAYFASGHHIFNNILINESDGYTLWAEGQSSTRPMIDSSDNNVYYSPKQAHIMYNVANGDIAAWNRFSGFDSKSFLLNPKFTHKDSLFTYDSRLDGKGAPLINLTTDIQGEKRSTSKPDIGADEFEPLKNDVFLEAVVSPTGISCKGFHEAKVRVRNIGTDTLRSLTIGYNVDDIFNDTISYTLSLPSNKDSILSLGKFYYGDTLRWYKIFTSLPNNAFDRNQGNDTLLAPIRSALRDTYTIAQSGSYYNSITKALNHLDSFGICGPVVFNIDDGNYEERIFLNNYMGSSKTNSITFRSSSGDSSKVWIMPKFADASLDSNYVVLANYAQNIIFKGITFNATYVDNGTVVNIKNNTSRIVFTNCQFIGQWQFYENASLFNSYQNCDSIVIKNNLIKHGNNGIRFIGTSSSNKIQNIIIDDNIFEDIWYKNIYLENINNLTINRNIIDSGKTGIALENISGHFSASGNKIQVIEEYEGYNGGIGISLSGTFSASARGLISNNMIVANSNYGACGIKIDGTYIDVFHNSVKITSTWDETFALEVMHHSTASGNRIINNALINNSKGHAIFIYLVGSSSAGPYPYCDYNALFTNGKYIARGPLGLYTTLKDWIKSTKLDSHSVNALPAFFDSLDLHVQSSNLNNKALPLATVQKDIDNESRSLTKPDIGADEYNPIAHDLAIQSIFSTSDICGDSATYFGIVIENQGANSEKDFEIKLTISGTATTSLDSVFKVTLSTTQADTFFYSTRLNTVTGGTYNLSAWLKLSGDLYAENDSSKSTIKILARQTAPVIKDTLLCAGSYLVLKPANASSAKINWYISANSASSFLSADSLVINSVYKDTMFYISAVPANGCESYRTQVKVKVNQKPANAQLLKGNIFNGNFNDGSISNPDLICEGSVDEYLIQTPRGFSDSTYGKDWKISSLQVLDLGSNTIFADTIITWPSSAHSGKILFKPGLIGSKKSLQITLAISDIKAGCDTVFDRYVNIMPLPEVNWGVNTVCEGDDFTFADSSSGGASYFWQFGDGNSSNDQNPKYNYAKAGKYQVKLKVTNATGCTDSLTKSVTVYPVPLVNFKIPSSVCENEAFVIENLSSFKDSLKYSWKFGDNTFSTDSAVMHKYSTQGNYNITLTAYNAQGCSRSLTKTIIVKSRPVSSFLAPDTVCAGENIYYRNTGSSSVNYLWIFSNGDTITTRHVTQNFSKEGNYFASLIIANSNGCTDTFTQNISILSIPKPGFEAATVCEGDSTIFTNKSNTAGQAGAKYFWRFGDGTTSSLENPGHLYSKAGYFEVTLIVSGKGKCKDSITKQITVGGKPKIAFKTSGACLSDIFTFTDLSQPTFGKIVSRSWDFGNGETSVDSVAQYKFSKAGKYAVSLQAKTELGCTERMIDTVEVFDLPIADFTADTVCAGNPTSFSNNSIGNYAQLWYFGDGDSSFSNAPKHTYKTNGNYNVVLLVVSAHACIDTFKQTIQVLELPSAAFSYTSGSGGAVSFVPDDLGYSSYSWYFGDGKISDSMSPTHTYGADGVYTVSLVTTNSNGCTDSSTKQVTIKTLGIENADNYFNTVEVFPNPFNTSVTIKYSHLNAENVKIVILDVQGKEVLRKDLGKQPAGKYSEIVSSNIAAGTYTLHMLLGEKIVARKIIKLK